MIWLIKKNIDISALKSEEKEKLFIEESHKYLVELRKKVNIKDSYEGFYLWDLYKEIFPECFIN